MSADHQAHGLSIADAARHLAISENAVRQRIKRGTLAAVKVDGVWRVTIDETDLVGDHEVDYQADQESRPSADHETGYKERPPADYETTSQPAVSVSARAQLSALVEEMLAPIIAQHEEQTAQLARQLGRTEAERDQARQETSAARLERDALQAELDRLREAESAHAPQDAQDGPGRVTPPEMDSETSQGTRTASSAGSESLWRRLRRAISGG